ncbi:mCG1038666, partial [Mus musculus]
QLLLLIECSGLCSPRACLDHRFQSSQDYLQTARELPGEASEHREKADQREERKTAEQRDGRQGRYLQQNTGRQLQPTI